MSFLRIEPSSNLKPVIECFWIVKENGIVTKKEKIVPDGFPEIIFHFGDPYRINISGRWKTQSRSLLAGQIREHFFLENTGTSNIFGIKLKPSAVTHLFGLSMSRYTDKVVNLKNIAGKRFHQLDVVLVAQDAHSVKRKKVEQYFEERMHAVTFKENIVDHAINNIFERRGMINVSELSKEYSVTERQLERLFKMYVGLSPKFYARIIRFNHIFQLIQEKKSTWSDLAYWGGYYDQSHFIKNFKDFTGDEPSAYPFAKETLANFFLKK